MWLHRFEITKQFADAVQETCMICGGQKIFKTYKGRTDNYRYIDYHVRNALPKFHPLFKREYPYAR